MILRNMDELGLAEVSQPKHMCNSKFL